MNEQEIIQKYEHELVAAKNKISEMQQARDDFAGKNEALQQKIEVKEHEIKTLQERTPVIQKKNNNIGWIVFLLFLCIGLAILSIIFYDELDTKRDYNSVKKYNSELQTQVNGLQKYEDDYNSLTQVNINLRNEISNLKTQVPVWYKAISDANIYYKENCGNNGNVDIKMINCHLPAGYQVKVYQIENGYGLTQYGWILMSEFERY